ncbi:MAG: ABC transporter ATP-binding protein [Gammaproteobacteria bacterium]
MSALLEVRNLVVGYGGIEAVHGVSLQLAAGELVSLIGSNGAGKSTTLNALAGLLPARRGEIHFAGERIDRLPAHQRVERGLVLVPEGRGIFPQLTVEENLLMGAFHRRDHEAIRRDLAQQYTQFPRLAERRRQLAGTLSGGEQQMVAMARALMARPRLLLLDEPSMGLAPLMVQTIFSVIRQVAAEGMTILLVEQNAQAALAIASQAHVMDHGEITLSGPAAQLQHDPKVREAYLGG